jgi:hypothetical protein
MSDPGRRHRHVVNADEIEPQVSKKGARYAFTRRQLAQAAAGRGLGASLMEVPAGKAAWPRHYHCANEEAVFVVQLPGKGHGPRMAPISISGRDFVVFHPHSTVPVAPVSR